MTARLPDVAAILRPILASVPAEERPLLLAIAERLAAERYRGWAAASDAPERRAGLLACAAREDEIAGRIEAVFPDAAAVQARLGAAHPEVVTVAKELFGSRSLDEQLAIQAAGERAGASAWRALAAAAPDGPMRQAFLACAPLEEASAAYLESLAS
jgi:hypothetical protein